MAVNNPKGDNARKGAIKKRTQLKNKLTGTHTKRSKKTGEFMDVKKTAKKFKGVRRETPRADKIPGKLKRRPANGKKSERGLDRLKKRR